MDKKIIVVTGATGHVGVGLLHELKKRNEFVRAVVTKDGKHDYIKNLCNEIVIGDVRDIDCLEKIFKGASVVYHLAGIITIGAENKSLLKSVNIDGTKNVINACKKCGVKRLIYTSSVHAISIIKKGLIMKEQKQYNEKKLIGNYAKSKAIATDMVLKANSKKLETVVCFPSGVIGPYSYKLSNIGQLILDFANKRMPLYFDGAYNYVDVRDVAFGLAQAEILGKPGAGYILANRVMSIKEMLDILEAKTGVKKAKYKLPIWLLKIFAPFAELYYFIFKKKPVFTRYSLYTLSVNAEFSSDKAKKDIKYKTRDLKTSFEDEIDFVLNLKENKK